MLRIEIFEFNKEDISYLFYCLLNRINILVIGDSDETIQNCIVQISSLVSFRKEIIFGNDIVSIEEFIKLLIKEKDYPENLIKYIFTCPPTVFDTFLNTFYEATSIYHLYSTKKKEVPLSKDDFTSWIVGVTSQKFTKSLQEKVFLIFNNKYIELSLIEKKVRPIGFSLSQKDFTFEQKVFDLINSLDSKSHYIKMQDEIEKLVYSAIDTSKLVDIKDFLQEFIKSGVAQIRNQVINDEFQNFATIGKKIFMVLSKLRDLFVRSKAYNLTIQSKYRESIGANVAPEVLIDNNEVDQKYLNHCDWLVNEILHILHMELSGINNDKIKGEIEDRYKLPHISEGTLNKISGFKDTASFNRFSEFIEGEYGLNLYGFVGGKEGIDALSKLVL